MTGFAPLGSTALGQSSTNANYALSVTSGTFTLSMQGAAKLISDVYPFGTFLLDGKAVTMTAQRPADFDTGAFAYTGQDVELDQNFGLIIDTLYNNSQFTYTGHDVVLDVGFGIGAETGSFSFTGQSINFTKQMNISAETGVFTYTGQDALKGIGEVFAVGTFTYTGQTVDMSVQRLFSPVLAGAFNYSFAADTKTRGWFSPTVPPTIWTDAA